MRLSILYPHANVGLHACVHTQSHERTVTNARDHVRMWACMCWPHVSIVTDLPLGRGGGVALCKLSSKWSWAHRRTCTHNTYSYVYVYVYVYAQILARSPALKGLH